MEPVELPKPSELKPGTRWNLGPGIAMTLHQGKHGPKDLAVEVHGQGCPTHRGIALFLMAVMKSEQRYLDKGKAGAEYFISFLGSVAFWFRSHEHPKRVFALRTDDVEGEELGFPNSWTHPTGELE